MRVHVVENAEQAGLRPILEDFYDDFIMTLE